MLKWLIYPRHWKAGIGYLCLQQQWNTEEKAKKQVSCKDNLDGDRWPNITIPKCLIMCSQPDLCCDEHLCEEAMQPLQYIISCNFYKSKDE